MHHVRPDGIQQALASQRGAAWSEVLEQHDSLWGAALHPPPCPSLFRSPIPFAAVRGAHNAEEASESWSLCRSLLGRPRSHLHKQLSCSPPPWGAQRCFPSALGLCRPMVPHNGPFRSPWSPHLSSWGQWPQPGRVSNTVSGRKAGSPAK